MERVKKNQSFSPGSKLSCNQLKIDSYKYKEFCVSLNVTTKHKSVVDTQKKEKGIKA